MRAVNDERVIHVYMRLTFHDGGNFMILFLLSFVIFLINKLFYHLRCFKSLFYSNVQRASISVVLTGNLFIYKKKRE